MTSIIPFPFNGLQFQLLCNSQRGTDGIIIPIDMEWDDVENFDAFLEGLTVLQHLYKYIRAVEWFDEYGVYYADNGVTQDFQLEYAELVLKANASKLIPVSELIVSLAQQMLAGEHKTVYEPKVVRPPKPGYVYLLQSNSGHFKIGRTSNPKNRAKTFGVQLPFEVEFLCLIQTPDMHALEQDLHSHFVEKRINGEWFELTPEDVAYIKEMAT